MALSEKELIAVTFIAVTALAKRLTGEDLLVTIEGEDGRTRTISGSDGHITWVSDHKKVEVSDEVIQEARLKPPHVLLQAQHAPRQCL